MLCCFSELSTFFSAKTGVVVTGEQTATIGELLLISPMTDLSLLSKSNEGNTLSFVNCVEDCISAISSEVETPLISGLLRGGGVGWEY